MRIALYQPDIAGNVGAVMRLATCLGVALDIIMPCGFTFSDKTLKRAAMDYGAACEVERHANAEAFFATMAGRRILLMTSAGDQSLERFAFAADDVLLFGSESRGAPPDVHDRADARLRIAMQRPFRSLNLAVSAGIALHEAMRQTGQLPT